MVRLTAVLLLVPVLASAQEAFQLPSGNIRCLSVEGRLRCDILGFTYRPPPRPHDCDLDWGGAVEIGATGRARLVCPGARARVRDGAGAAEVVLKGAGEGAAFPGRHPPKAERPLEPDPQALPDGRRIARPSGTKRPRPWWCSVAVLRHPGATQACATSRMNMQ